MGLGPASGLCCGYTMTRAILSDAIALVRGECDPTPLCPSIAHDTCVGVGGMR